MPADLPVRQVGKGSVHTHRPEQCAGDSAPATVSHDEQVRALRLFDQHGGRRARQRLHPDRDPRRGLALLRHHRVDKPRVACWTSLMICSSVGIAAL